MDKGPPQLSLTLGEQLPDEIFFNIDVFIKQFA